MSHPENPALQPLAGTADPIGASLVNGGVNFSVFSRSAAGVSLLLFDHPEQAQPQREIPLHPVLNRTYHYWHVFVPGLSAGQLYAYRVSGPFTPENGLRFDAGKVLLDPCGRGVVIPSGYSRVLSSVRGADNCATAMKSVVVDPSDYDWEGDRPLRRPLARTVIYEMHVRGFTRHPNSGVPDAARGTFAGLVEKIPYLRELGITAVELMPVFAFDAQDCPPGRVNYWGYAPVSFFAPHPAYSSRQDPLGPVREFRDMVKALHRGGLEVILDVVFNHTAEGSADGPTQCFRGIDNPTYYIPGADPSRYANYSGCGNTLNANHPVVRRMILDSLRYWVREMHVDGFRFDLASILARDAAGIVLPNPPLILDIESDPVLAGTKLIAEAWDAAGLYQVGSFVGDAWKEWNGCFRDDVRDFFRGVPGSAGRMADRILGSHQVYGHEQRDPEQSVNFVTCHDGFTLNDLVSYNHKHNDENGEDNRDGTDDNRSWNCGVEGPSSDPEVERLRGRQIRNFLTVTVVSLGIPMISMGDEVRRTQKGNNNAYCQDNEISWFDWSLVDRHQDIRRFLSLLLEARMFRSVAHEEQRATLTEVIRRIRQSWHGVQLSRPDWNEFSHSFALQIEAPDAPRTYYLILNAYSGLLTFDLPPVREGTTWRRWIDTSLPAPDDIVRWEQAVSVTGSTYDVGPLSVVILLGPPGITTDADVLSGGT